MKKTLFKLVAVVFSAVLFFSGSVLAESDEVEVLDDVILNVETSSEDIETEGEASEPKKDLEVENEAGIETEEDSDFEVSEVDTEDNKHSKPVIKQIKELVAEVNTPIDFFDYFEIYDENTPFDELFYEFGWLELPLTPGVYKVEARVKNNDGVETVEFYDFKIVESLDELEEETEKEVEKETSKEDKKDSEKESSETKELPKAGTSSLGLPMLGLGVILKLISRKQ